MLRVVFISILILSSFLASEKIYFNKRERFSPYECGFEHCSSSRVPFSMRFFLLALIFLIFDLEVLFLMLIPEVEIILSNSVLIYCTLFVVILIVGLLLEWIDGGLD
jgi:NADH-ubiquinone oxidoreductase chain 3